MNPWMRGSILVNPYYRTAFKVARLPREVIRHRTVVRIIGQTRQIVETGGHLVQSRPVSASEVNAAEQILLDPVSRVLEELLEHAAEKPPVELLRKLLKEAVDALAPNPEAPFDIKNVRSLDAWLPSLLAEFLEENPGPSASFGALELDIAPPFGREEEL
jgi:hypothetical protein